MTDYKTKNDIPDLYHILGLTPAVCSEPDCNERIRKAYTNLAKKCHPDKHPGRKEVEEVFELLTRAYDILKDEKQRAAYNHKLSLNKQSSNDFISLKNASTKYMESMGEYKPPTKEQELEFANKMKMLDEKHGYDETKINKISSDDAKKLMNDAMKTRADQDRIYKPEKLFDEGRFDLKKFNAAFDKIHNKEDTTITLHNGVPLAWNGTSTTGYSNFDDLDNLYVEDHSRLDTSGQIFGSTKFNQPNKLLTKEEVSRIAGADYVDGHNNLDDDYYRNLRMKLNERKAQANDIDNMSFNDYKRDDTAGYGIFDKLGFKIDDRLSLDVDDDDISKRFEKLMEERKTDPMIKSNKNKNDLRFGR